MGVYDEKPSRFLQRLADDITVEPASGSYCAGFEVEQWRCDALAFHLAEWLPEYALPEDELRIHHGNSLMKLHQAALRVYTSEKYKKRGEAGEIALHAICRDYFETIPISPRVFYKTASNDVVKAFDMVHARFPSKDELEIWLGESKLWTNGSAAISDAIKSITTHVEAGFLSNQKMLLGPQIPKTTPNYEKILSLFEKNTSLDELVDKAVFPVAILYNSAAVAAAKSATPLYRDQIIAESSALRTALQASKLHEKIRIVLIYIPLHSKDDLVAAFDKRLKALQ